MRAQHARDDRAAVREVRADARGALASRTAGAARAPRGGPAAATSASSPSRLRSEIGSEISISVLRPLKSTWKNLRRRLVSAQSSTSSRRSNEPSFCGARPQYTATGTRSTSSRVRAQRLDHLHERGRRTAVEALVPEAERAA